MSKKQQKKDGAVAGPLLLVGVAALLLMLLQFAGKIRLPGALGDAVDQIKGELEGAGGQFGQGVYDAGHDLVTGAAGAVGQAADAAGRGIIDFFKRVPPLVGRQRPDDDPTLPPDAYRVTWEPEAVPVHVPREAWEARHARIRAAQTPTLAPTFQPLPAPPPAQPILTTAAGAGGSTAARVQQPAPVHPRYAAKVAALEAAVDQAARIRPTTYGQNLAAVSTATHADKAAALVTAAAATAPWWVTAGQAFGQLASTWLTGLGQTAGRLAPNPAGFLAVPNELFRNAPWNQGS